MAIILKVEVTGGSGIEEAAREIQDIADRLLVSVEAEFNGVTCTAIPGGDARLLAERQQAEQRGKDRYKFCSSRP